MRCQSGMHEWVDPVSAERCCKPEWKRVLRILGDGEDDLDPDGRVYHDVFVNGWVKVHEEAME
jgi:hypothetical protein